MFRLCSNATSFIPQLPNYRIPVFFVPLWKETPGNYRFSCKHSKQQKKIVNHLNIFCRRIAAIGLQWSLGIGRICLSPTITIHLAKTSAEFEGAFRLLQRAREESGLARPGERDLWLLKHHALPSTNTVVAMQAGRVIGALCLFGDSPFHLPVESQLDLKAFRRNLEGRLAELSLPGIDPEAPAGLLYALYHFAVCFGSSYCDYDGFVTEASLAWVRDHGEKLHYQRIFEPLRDRQLLFLNARNEKLDYRANAGPGCVAEFCFPEKKFFLVAHQSMPPEVVNYLFNERTKLFASLSDADLRVLKNVYDWGEYAKLLPNRDLHLPEKKTPRFPRFPMNCEGFLVTEDGSREHVHLLDVSREGLKLRMENAPDKGVSYVLTLYVGVKSKTELIARAMWIDTKAGIAGFEVKSGDASWKKLIDYLEKEGLSVA
jgi:hypothetical protein